MGNEERERKFERALERHLRRNAAGASHEADARADVRNEIEATVACPDAATLAAFHEGLLLNEEMNATTEHIAGCSRCHRILVQLEATDEIPLQAEPEDIFAKREPVLSTGAQYVDQPAMQTSSPTISGQPKTALKAPKDISRGRGFKALRWAVPAGAIAAGLLVWIVVRDSRVPTLDQVENVQVAQEQSRNERLATPPAVPTSPAPEPFTRNKPLNEPRKDAGRINPSGEVSGGLRASERASDAFTTGADLEAHAETSDAKAPTAPRPSGNESLQARARANPESRESRQNEVAAVSETKAAAASAPAASRDLSNLITLAPPSKAKTEPPRQGTDTVSPSAAPMDTSSGDLSKQSAVPATPASSGAAANATDKKAKAAPAYTTQSIIDEVPALPTERMATPDKLYEPSLETRGRTALGGKIMAPGAIVLWRLGAKGQIERSADGGASWVRQSSGVKSELLGGSAPSESVCWIIGRGGTILKTTDGGVHWSKVAWPNAGEITGIQAFDAMHVIVYGGTADIPGRFATNDGGATWFRPNK